MDPTVTEGNPQVHPPTIDGYVCSRLLGLGGMGAVFLAHPFLPKILDGGRLPGSHDTFLVMELLEGLDLGRSSIERRPTGPEGPFCLAGTSRTAPALILECVWHGGNGPDAADALEVVAAASSDADARDRLRFTAAQIRIHVLDSTEATPEVCAPQVRILEARDRVLGVLRGFVTSAPALEARDSLTLHYAVFQAITRGYPETLMQPDRPEHVEAAQDLADTIIRLTGGIDDGSADSTILRVASGLYEVGRRREAWKTLETLDPERLSQVDRCDLHRTRASFFTAERSYDEAVDEQRAARRLARTDAMRTSIDRNTERIRTLQVVWPAGQGTDGP